MENDLRNEGMWEEINHNRNFMKCPDLDVELHSDQDKKMPQPPLNIAAKGEVIELPTQLEMEIINPSYTSLLDSRRSERFYDKKAYLAQNQLAYLLWSIQGIQEIRGEGYASLRPVPSGGARHPFELYFFARAVEGLRQGIYHYLPQEHIGEKRSTIEFHGEIVDYKERVTRMLAGQKWAAAAQIVLFFSCVPYRGEWRYNTFAHRVMLIDLGHAGQNAMLSAAALGLESCCIAAYDQVQCDEALGLDGYEEYTVYACAVGKPRH